MTTEDEALRRVAQGLPPYTPQDDRDRPLRSWADEAADAMADVERERRRRQPPATAAERHHVLLGALAGPYTELALTSPRFRDALEQLARILPLMVEALATTSRADEERDARAIELMRRTAPATVITTDMLAAAGLPTTYTNGEPVDPADAPHLLRFADELRRLHPGKAVLIDPPQEPSERLVDLMANLDASVREAKEARDRHPQPARHTHRHIIGCSERCSHLHCTCACHVPHAYVATSDPYTGCAVCGRGPWADGHWRLARGVTMALCAGYLPAPRP